VPLQWFQYYKWEKGIASWLNTLEFGFGTKKDIEDAEETNNIKTMTVDLWQ
jgi:hypothetical protein